MVNRSATNTRVVQKRHRDLPLWIVGGDITLWNDTQGSPLRRIFIEEGEGAVESRASRRRSAGNHLETASPTKIRTRLNLSGQQAAAGKLERKGGKGRVCGFRPFPLFVFVNSIQRIHARPPPFHRNTPTQLRGGSAISSTLGAEWNCQPCFSGGHHRAVPIGHGPRPAIDSRGTREALVHRPRRICPSFRQGLYFICVCLCFFIPLTYSIYVSCFFLSFEDVDW